MLVEDDNNLREIYGARLLAEGHEIVTAKDGEEALAIAVKEKPELIISDVMMPKISGFDMLDILRNAPETKFTKVIMMTALSQTEDKARADSLGADRYLVKSQVTLEDVARVVRDVLDGKTEAEGNTASAVAPEPAPEATPEAEPETTNSEVSKPMVPELTAPIEASVPTPTLPAEPAHQPVAGVTPEVVPVSEPTATPVVTAPDPVTEGDSSTTQISVTTPVVTSDPVTTPTTDDSATTTSGPATPVPQFNVELPSLEVKEETPAEPEATPTPVTESVDGPSIGPNLMEALQQETDKPAEEPNSVEPANTTPTVMNGAENNVITPTVTAPEIPEEPAVEATPPSEEIAEITNTESGSVVKKGVIQPLSDMTTGPDLGALLDAEEKKAPVETPPANTVITPASTAPEVPTSADTPAPTSEHDIISL